VQWVVAVLSPLFGYSHFAWNQIHVGNNSRHSGSTSGQMFKDSTNRMDDYPTDSEDGVQIELQQFLHTQHDVKIPTRKEARTARSQFLALCWSLFLMGWISGSTGPLLPSIQKSYDVGEPSFLSTFSVQRIIQVGFETVSWIFVLGSAVSDVYLVVFLDVVSLHDYTLHTIFREQFWEHC
jgi:hypothetical protein